MTLAILGAGLAAWLLGSAVPVRRLRAASCGQQPVVLAARVRRSGLWTSPWFAAGLAVVAVTRLVTGVTGLVAAAVVAVGVHRWVAGLESAQERRRRERVTRDLPLAVDLMVAAMGAGRPHGQVLGLVADAVGGPLAEELDLVGSRLQLGADPAAVWRSVADRPGLEPLGRSFARATETGAPLRVVLSRTVDDLRAARHAQAQQTARAVGVRTAAPLGACFLPAFLLTGVVPTLVGAFEHLVL